VFEDYKENGAPYQGREDHPTARTNIKRHGDATRS